MVGSSKKHFVLRGIAVLMVCAGLGACASAPYDDDDYGGRTAAQARSIPPIRNGGLQCVPYARAHSGVKIQGDAYTWWDKAQGRYARSREPAEGAVLVLYNYAGPARGHVAVVRDVVSSREIRIDHANWLDDGAIYTDDPVRDVSPNNDWTAVRVFNQRAGAWGGRVYPVQGFIGPGSEQRLSDGPMAANNPKYDAIATLLAQDDADGTN